MRREVSRAEYSKAARAVVCEVLAKRAARRERRQNQTLVVALMIFAFGVLSYIGTTPRQYYEAVRFAWFGPSLPASPFPEVHRGGSGFGGKRAPRLQPWPRGGFGN